LSVVSSSCEFPGTAWSGHPRPIGADSCERIVLPFGRLAAFLRYVVEEAIAGRSSGLKEQTIAAALYKRLNGEDDSTVRADARRVRDKLREYYASSPLD
jgi:hypothetical protein